MDDEFDINGLDDVELDYGEPDVHGLDKEFSEGSVLEARSENDAVQSAELNKTSSSVQGVLGEESKPSLTNTNPFENAAHKRQANIHVQAAAPSTYPKQNIRSYRPRTYPPELPVESFPRIKKFEKVHVNPRYLPALLRQMREMNQMRQMHLHHTAPPMSLDQAHELQQRQQLQQLQRQGVRVQHLNPDMMQFGTTTSRVGDKRSMKETIHRELKPGLAIKGVTGNYSDPSTPPTRHIQHNQSVTSPPAIRSPKSQALVTNMEGITDDQITAIARESGYEWLETKRTDRGFAVTFSSADGAKLFRRKYNKTTLGDKGTHINIVEEKIV